MTPLSKKPITRAGRARRRVVVAVLAVAAVACVVVPAAFTAVSRPACFGAASRDAAHRCKNPKLARMVVPTLGQALLSPNIPCKLVQAPITVCALGVAPAPGVPAMALVGDSHAAHWRAGIGVLARRLGWSGVAITWPSCPFTQGVLTAPEPKRSECINWNRDVLAWFGAHPEVSTMFVSGHSGPVITEPGQTRMEAHVAGIIAGWDAVPATVKHIVVLRDVPFIKQSTLPCVERARIRRKDAGRLCAVPRRDALHRDPLVVAARQLNSPRVQVIDVSDFFCDRRRCFPVVGGALVFYDTYDHITSTFSASLGPYLLEDLERLMRSWPAP